MENINFEHRKGKCFILTDFPDAKKLIKISGIKSQELAAMTLHKLDLDNSLECLLFLEKQKSNSFEEMVFWKMSIIYFMRCFGKNNARKSKLNIKDILIDDNDGIEVFKYFKNLRNKNIAHDENPFQQCIPSAVVNKKDAKNKIVKIVCLSAQGEVSSIDNINNLKLLISKIKIYVINKFDNLCDDITKELESIPYSDLIKIESPTYNKPNVEDMGKNRD